MLLFDFLDIITFTICTITVLYLLIFAVAGSFKHKDECPGTKIKNRFAVLIPVYKDDEYIIPTVRAIMRQDYPIDCFEIIVIADHLHPDTILQLSQLPITLIQANFKNSSKTKSLKAATKVLNKENYDIAVILNSDNLSDTDFLYKINNTFTAGSNAIQSHRIHQERNSSIAVIDAIADEINNTIVRLGHTSLGLSSSLNGSGMAFDYNWFYNNINKLKDYEDEKVLESLLLQDKVFIDYLDDVKVYSTKSFGNKKFYNQRKNWILSQYNTFFKNVKSLPKAFISGNFDFADRIIQWGIFPRSIAVLLIIIFTLLCIFIKWTMSVKWIILFLVLLFTFALAIPNYLVDNKFNKAMKMLPFIGFTILFKLILRKK